MLLIDPQRNIASVPPHASLFPFILRDFGGDTRKIANVLTRAAPLERLVPLLLREFAATGHPPKLNVSLPMLLVTEAARAIAHGTIKLGFTLPETVAIRFRTGTAVESHHDDAIRFANPQAATDFLRRCLKSPAIAEAFAAALAYPRASGLRAPAGDGRTAWLANLMLLHGLGLFPDGTDLARLRLSWIEHRSPTQGAAAAASPPPPPPPPAAIVQSAPSTLPDLPAEVSAQAQTLIDAAKDGVPFCEECAKAAAAALAGA